MQLITGGLGFIGNELARQLLKQEVAVLDNRNRVAPQIEDLARIPVLDVDLTSPPDVMKALKDLKPRTVYHLAAIHYIPECNENPERTLRVNVEATMGLLRACHAAGVEHVLFTSSGAVYRDSPDPLEEASAIEPVDIYGWSKWFAEELCRWFSGQTGLRVTICRVFNNYGPRETNRHIVPEIIHQLKQGDELQLGNTAPRRDYIYVTDTCEALRRLAAIPPDGHRTVNIASGCHASVDELIGMMGQFLKRKLRVVHDPKRFRKADKLVQVADISCLERLIRWKPIVGLEEGLKALLRFEGLLK